MYLNPTKEADEINNSRRELNAALYATRDAISTIARVIANGGCNTVGGFVSVTLEGRKRSEVTLAYLRRRERELVYAMRHVRAVQRKIIRDKKNG